MPSLRVDGEFNMAIIGEDLTEVAQVRQRIVHSVFANEVKKQGMNGHIIDCSHESDYRLDGNDLYIDNQKVHVLLNTTAKTVNDCVLHAFGNGTIFWPDSPYCFAYNNKLNFALLHQHKDSGVFSTDERLFIEKYVPKSWQLSQRQIECNGQYVPTSEYLRLEQSNLVLKDATGRQGDNVFVGRSLAVDDWRNACEMAISKGSWLIQEYCESMPFLGQSGEKGLAEFDLVWGIFALGNRYGGCQVRMKEKRQGNGVINAAKGAKEGIVFEVKNRLTDF